MTYVEKAWFQDLTKSSRRITFPSWEAAAAHVNAKLVVARRRGEQTVDRFYLGRFGDPVPSEMSDPMTDRLS